MKSISINEPIFSIPSQLVTCVLPARFIIKEPFISYEFGSEKLRWGNMIPGQIFRRFYFIKKKKKIADNAVIL